MDVKIAIALVESDVPFTMPDTISPLMKNIFDDSKIAYSKTTCIVNGALKEYYKYIFAVTTATIFNQNHG